MLRKEGEKVEKVAYQTTITSQQHPFELTQFLTALRGYRFGGSTLATLSGWEYVLVLPDFLNNYDNSAEVDVSLAIEGPKNSMGLDVHHKKDIEERLQIFACHVGEQIRATSWSTMDQ